MTSEQINEAIGRLRGMKISSRDFIIDVCRAFIGGEVTGDELHYTLIELLEQADPDTHMELPRDSDGVPIHEGDTMEFASGKRMEVAAVSRGGFFYYTYCEEAKWTDVTNKRHYHKPTVEDVLHEFATGISTTWIFPTDDNDKFVQEKIAEYAAKLREVIADE